MLWIKFNGQIPVEASTEVQNGPEWQSRWEWKSLEQVQKIARLLSINTGKNYVGADSGPNVSPCFDVIEMWNVGDKVSYTFNGDYYPDGEIVKITKTGQVLTSEGNRYIRRGESPVWLRTGGTWALVHGWRSDKNPCF